MSHDRTHGTLHHDLRGALSAVQMNLQTLEALEAGRAEVTPEKRLAILRRAAAALAQALELTDRLKPEGSGRVAGHG